MLRGDTFDVTDDLDVAEPLPVSDAQRSRIGDRQVIATVSGGKDSVAMWLWARRNGLNPVAVYADTQWEWDEPDAIGATHYQHLELLEARIDQLHRVVSEPGLAASVVAQKTFPTRVHRWCTKELKLKPISNWLDRYRAEMGADILVIVGVRREESADRADPKKTPEWEWSDIYDCEMWRPMLDWTVQQVIYEHRRAAIPMHPLYHHGAERVGCFPCINADKAELRLVSELAPKRVAEIRRLEALTGKMMFLRRRDGARAATPWPIDEVLTWAKTKHGGKEIQLERPRTGCARWGICEHQPDP